MTAEAEARLLAAMVNADSEIVRSNRLAPEAFGLSVFEQVYRAIVRVADERETVTQLLVHRELVRHGADATDAVAALERIASTEPTISPSTDARALAEAHRDREMQAACAEAASMYRDGRAEEGRAVLQAAIEGVGVQVEEVPIYTPRELIEISRTQETGGLNLAIPIIRRAIPRIAPGSMTVIGGQTNSGKSTFALYTTQGLDQDGHIPGIVSLEDPEEIWGERFDYQLAETAVASRIRTAVLSRHDLSRVIEAMWTLVRRHRCDVLVVDYIQLIKRRDMPGMSRAVVVSQTARDLKTEAKRLGVPLILVSQIVRNEKTSRWKEPTMFDLKESGDLENNAENIVLIWKTGDTEEARVLGKVAKVKNNPARPRFELIRSETGKLMHPIPQRRVEDEDEPDTGWSRGYGGGGS